MRRKRDQSVTPDNTWRSQLWEAIGRGLAAHALMLRDSEIVDDTSAAEPSGERSRSW